MRFFGRSLGGRKGRPAERRNLLTLKLGDIVSYNMEDYEVIGVLGYDDSGWRWTDYQLESAQKRLWLSVEQDDELEVGIYEKVRLDLDAPPGRRFTFRDKVYYLDEASRARIVRVEGQVGATVGNLVRYWDFADEEQTEFLSIEEWDGDYEASLGQDVDSHELELIAGS